MQALQKGKGQFYPVLVRPQTICVESFDLDEKCRDNPLLLWYARDLFRFSQELKSKTITPTNEFLATRWNCGHSKVQQLLDRLNQSGRLFLTHTKINDRLTLRFSIGQTGTRRPHVEAAWETIRATASEL